MDLEARDAAMFCPKCGSEYLETVSICPDCGERLAEKLEDRSGSGSTSRAQGQREIEFVKILHTYSPNDVAILISVLDASGITYFIQGENLIHIRQAAEPAILLVDREQEEEARELLKDMNIGYFIVSSLKDSDNYES